MRPGRRVADRVQVGAAVVRDDALRVAGGARGVRDRDRVPLVARAGERRAAARGRRAAPRTRARRGARRRRRTRCRRRRSRSACGRASSRRMRSAGPIVGASSRSVISTAHSQWFICQASSGGVEPGVERVEHRVQGRHRVVRLDHLGRVVQHRADRRAAADAERAQRRRQPRRAIARLAPACSGAAPWTTASRSPKTSALRSTKLIGDSATKFAAVLSRSCS